MKIIANIFYTIFITGLVAVALLLLGTLVPIPGNIAVKVVKSGSMEPVIHTGSVVIIRPVTEYRVGDIITFGPDTKVQIPTTHRIIADSVANGTVYYQTKGDANEEPDSKLVSEKEIIGRVLLTVPYAGFIVDFARQPIGFFLLIVVPAVAVIIEELITVWNEIRSKRRKAKMADVAPKNPHDA